MNNFARNLRMSMGMFGNVPSATDTKTKTDVWNNIRQRNAARAEQERNRKSYTDRAAEGKYYGQPLAMMGAGIADAAHQGKLFLQKGYDNIKDTIDVAQAPKAKYKNIAPKYFEDGELADVSDFNDIDTTRDFYVVNNFDSRPGGHIRLGYKNGKIATVYLPDEDFGDPIYGKENVENFFRNTFSRDDYESVFVSASEPGKFAEGMDTDDRNQYPYGKHYFGNSGPFRPGKVFALNNRFGGKYHKEFGM